MTRNQSDAAPKGPGRKQSANGAAGRAAPTAGEVARYLRRHPDFLVENPELLEALDLPRRDHGEGVVDLQSFVVERLRTELARTRTSRDELLATGRHNLAAQSRVHRAIIALMAAPSFELLIETITTDLAVMLDLDVVTLGVEQAEQGRPTVRLRGVFQLEPDTVDAVIGPGRDMLLRPEVRGDPALFGPGAGLVRSDALIRLTVSRKTPPAMLALGSRQQEQFHPGQGTELLSFLGRALEQNIRAWLNLPE